VAPEEVTSEAPGSVTLEVEALERRIRELEAWLGEKEGT
jgi:hypothetical protein